MVDTYAYAVSALSGVPVGVGCVAEKVVDVAVVTVTAPWRSVAPAAYLMPEMTKMAFPAVVPVCLSVTVFVKVIFSSLSFPALVHGAALTSDAVTFGVVLAPDDVVAV